MQRAVQNSMHCPSEKERNVAEYRIPLVRTLVVAVALLCLTTLGTGTPALAQDDKDKPVKPPTVDAGSWAVADAESGRLLTSQNPDKRLPIASTTKVMVALVALDEGVDLDEEVTISQNAASYAGFTYSNIGLLAGEKVSVRELLLASLVPSATDAVYALAEHLGDGRVGGFVEKMNDKAKEMNLENTHFENPAGLDSNKHYSSARDMLKITDTALEYKEFREMVDTVDASITTKDRKIEFTNTNYLLNTYPSATGVKTGTTPGSGASLISSAEAGDESYIAVVIGATSDDERFAGSRRILEYAFDNYKREVIVPEDKTYEKIDAPFRRDESVDLDAAEDVEVLVGPGAKIERRVTKDKPPDSVGKGDEIGKVEVLLDGQNVGETPLVAAKGYEEAGFFQKNWYRLSELW